MCVCLRSVKFSRVCVQCCQYTNFSLIPTCMYVCARSTKKISWSCCLEINTPTSTVGIPKTKNTRKSIWVVWFPGWKLGHESQQLGRNKQSTLCRMRLTSSTGVMSPLPRHRTNKRDQKRALQRGCRQFDKLNQLEKWEKADCYSVGKFIKTWPKQGLEGCN